MTVHGRPMVDEGFAADPERVLDAYADGTRIAASAALVRRFQASVATERAADHGPRRMLRTLAGRMGVGASLPRRAPVAAHATFALRLQGLALLLLLVLSLGVIAAGAGALVSTLFDGPRRGSEAPAHVVAPVPPTAPDASPRAIPSPAVPTPAPSIKVTTLAQRDPGRVRPADGRRRHPKAHRRPAAAPACAAIGGAAAMSAARPHAGARSCAF